MFILFVATDSLLNLYSIETRNLTKSEIYYLKKSIRVNDRVYSIRIKTGKIKPSSEEEKELVSKPNLALEKKVLEKRLELCTKSYNNTHLNSADIQKLEKTKYWSHFFRLFLSKAELNYVEETSRIEYIHGTTAIEGNTFSLQQVDDLLNRDIVPSAKSLREINEVQNYVSVENYLNDYSGKVTLQLIRKLHELIMDNIDLESAGVVRRIDSIGIRGVDISVTPAILIEEELQRIIDDYYINIQSGLHPFEESILFHYKFETVHPFIDGNGRVGRSILNYMLEKSGFPRLVITGAMREKYLEALHKGNKGDDKDMITCFVEFLEDIRAKVFEEILCREAVY